MVSGLCLLAVSFQTQVVADLYLFNLVANPKTGCVACWNDRGDQVVVVHPSGKLRKWSIPRGQVVEGIRSNDRPAFAAQSEARPYASVNGAVSFVPEDPDEFLSVRGALNGKIPMVGMPVTAVTPNLKNVVRVAGPQHDQVEVYDADLKTKRIIRPMVGDVPLRLYSSDLSIASVGEGKVCLFVNDSPQFFGDYVTYGIRWLPIAYTTYSKFLVTMSLRTGQCRLLGVFQDAYPAMGSSVPYLRTMAYRGKGNLLVAHDKQLINIEIESKDLETDY